MNITPERVRQVEACAQCLHDAKAVEKALDKMASEINKEFADKNPIVLSVMTGGIIPAGCLLPRFTFPMQLDYVHATCYKDDIRPGDLHWRIEPRLDLTDRHILIIDDILDRGVTLAAIIDYCQGKRAASIATAVLVDKAHPRAENGLKTADFTGLYIEDLYVFGYGLDYYGYLRNANGIFAVTE
jgi:hypoxanthine phosphoribosyltransferase